MIEYLATDTDRTFATAETRLVFTEADGRWTHRFDIRRGADWTTVAAAVEADESRAEPDRVVSPTYQEIQVPPAPAADTAKILLLGRFGAHHFAASVTFVARRVGPLPHAQAVFDIADRCRSTVRSLAATYAISLPAPLLADAEEDGLRWWTDDDRAGMILLHAVPTEQAPGRVTLSEAGRAAMLAQAAIEPDPAAATHRLLYSWAFAGAPDPTR